MKKVLSSGEVKERLITQAKQVYTAIDKHKAPSISMPLRSLTNVTYNPADGYFELKGSEKKRTLTSNTVKTFAQTLLLLNEAKQIIDTQDQVNKREAYYNSKNWGDAKFDEESEASSILEDIESMLALNREQLGFVPGERGGSVVGPMKIIDGTDTIDLTKQGSGSWSIPSGVEHLEFETKAEFVLVVETTALFDRLNKHGYWKKAKCIIVAMAGVPTRNTRRFVRRLSDEKKLPVYVFTDGDPYGYFNIYRTFKVGSGNAAHINEFFVFLKQKFLGVTPQDIIDYHLPTHPLKEVDIKRAKDALKNDPFVIHHKPWQRAIRQMIEMKKRVEQQAFAKHGYNFVHEKYLPEKLKKTDTWLP